MELTAREKQVARILLTGKPLADCAAELGITTGTMKQYSHRVYQAEGVRGRVELMARHYQEKSAS